MDDLILQPLALLEVVDSVRRRCAALTPYPLRAIGGVDALSVGISVKILDCIDSSFYLALKSSGAFTASQTATAIIERAAGYPSATLTQEDLPVWVDSKDEYLSVAYKCMDFAKTICGEYAASVIKRVATDLLAGADSRERKDLYEIAVTLFNVADA